MSVSQQSRLHANSGVTVRKAYIGGVGVITCFFGLLGPTFVNIYLSYHHSPLVTGYRTNVSYISGTIGDGIVVPVASMIMAWALGQSRVVVTRQACIIAAIVGSTITVCVHIYQAANNYVNWSMPSPWHWNVIGVWHAMYMVVICSYLVLFYVVMSRQYVYVDKGIHAVCTVSCSIVLFLVLLGIDYRDRLPIPVIKRGDASQQVALASSRLRRGPKRHVSHFTATDARAACWFEPSAPIGTHCLSSPPTP